MDVGSIELLRVPDAIGVIGDYGELYPEAPAEEWEPFRALYPELFAGESWRLPCASFLVRSAGSTILVDTGVGPPGMWGWTAEEEGLLPAALDDLGVHRDDVDVVFLTHMHIDHVGWNTDLEGEAFFPRARYVVDRESLAYASEQDGRPHVRRCILALAERFETVTGDVELAPGVTAFEARGHYPGHKALRLSSDGQEAIVLADIAVHPAMLDRADLAYVSDVDGDASIATRRALLPELVDTDVLVACGHYPGSGIGRVVTRDGHVVFEPLA